MKCCITYACLQHQRHHQELSYLEPAHLTLPLLTPMSDPVFKQEELYQLLVNSSPTQLKDHLQRAKQQSSFTIEPSSLLCVLHRSLLQSSQPPHPLKCYPNRFNLEVKIHKNQDGWLENIHLQGLHYNHDCWIFHELILQSTQYQYQFYIHVYVYK